MDVISIILYVCYYVCIPVVIIFLTWRLYIEKKYGDFFKSKYYQTKAKEELYQVSEERLQKIKVILVTVFLVLLPMWGLVASEITHQEMYYELVFIEDTYTHRNPVLDSLGPSFNTDEIIKEMKYNPDAWHPDLFEEIVDLDQLTKYPGRMAVYILVEDRYIITYTFLAPVPIVKGYGFQINEVDGEDVMIAQNEGTYIFPMEPSPTGRLGDVA
ncbi:MAG: hypothetical protein R6U61_03220 [Thermoplasmata archaeon]